MVENANEAEQRSHGMLPGTRVVASAQCLLGVAYLLGAGVVLLTAVVRTGHYESLLSPGVEQLQDPKDSIPPVGPASAWNPLTWIFDLARVVSMFIGPLAVIAGVVGLVYLLNTDRRSHRRAFTWLALGTAACAALVAIRLTPYGGQLQTWLLD